MRFIVIPAIAATLISCGSLNKVVSANERSVVVQAISGDINAATKLADSECKRFGRISRLSHQLQGTVEYLFDCVN